MATIFGSIELKRDYLYSPKDKDTPWAARMKDQWKGQMERDEVQTVIDAMRKRAGELGDISEQTLKKIREKIG